MRIQRLTILASSVLTLWVGVCGFYPVPQDAPFLRSLPFHPTLRLDGKFVHNVGRLHLQITNVGMTGNEFNPRLTTIPSAEWPPGSGNDYLFAAGLWVGALDATGIPHVTTAPSSRTYDIEFSPQLAPQRPCVNVPLGQVADVREAYEGIPGGNRVISSSINPDDDGDGYVDEDFLNGIDDDGDGLCDEDYAAIGQQMLACEYNDYEPTIRQVNPEHVPLGIQVQQTSYAWATPGQNDFVGMDYKIINTSGRALRNVYVGIFADMDLGNRVGRYFSDDEAGLVDTTVQYAGSTGEFVKRRIQMGYMWDNPDNPAKLQDAKGGDVPGYFGCMFLNHTTDPSGVTAPRRVGITSFKFFSGDAPFIAGGDPGNDAERYLLMSDPTLDPDVIGQVTSQRPLDYRFVMATGPFRTILPESALTVSVAWVMGLGRGPSGGGGTMIDNAISAQQAFDGLYTDLDGTAVTGTCGQETCLRSTDAGGQAFIYSIPESSLCRLRFHADVTSVFAQVPTWDPLTPCDLQQGGKYVCQDDLGGTLQNGGAHCASEDTLDLRITSPTCTYVDLDCDVNTGQGGREHLVNWVASAPLPAPFYAGRDGQGEVSDYLRLYGSHEDSVRVSAWFFPGDRRVTLKWNNFAEQVRDAQRGNLKEFTGYRIYRASGWNRPLGTNAPSHDLWSLLGEWSADPKGTSARPLSELIDPSVPFVNISPVQVRWDPYQRTVRNDSVYIQIDTLFVVGRYSFVDTHVLNGFPYFYSIVPVSVIPGNAAVPDAVLQGNPSASNAQVVYPRGDSRKDQKNVFVVPNPYKAGAEWDLVPSQEDPSGTKVTFMNLPATKGTIHIFTLAGDLVKDIPFNGRPSSDLQYGMDSVTGGSGSVPWNLISRNGQKIVSGIYLYSVDTELGRQVGRLVIIR